MAVEQGQATLERSDDDSVKMKQSLRLNPATFMKAHVIENMVAGTQVNDLTPSEMHASLARSSALVGDAEGTMHHLDHISQALSGNPALAAQMAEIRELLESEDLGDAAHELKDLVGDAHEEKHHEPEGHGH